MSAYKDNKRPNARTVFTTLDGTDIHFVPFSWDEYLLAKEGLKEEYRERGDIINPPQYKVIYAGGSSQWFDHDEKTIQQVPPNTTPEDAERIIAEQKETWAKYRDASKRFNDEDTALMLDFVYEDSLGKLVLPEDTTWEDRQRKRRIKIPTEPEEKRRHYINTVLCKRSDQSDLISNIVAISMGAVREDDVNAVINSFRDRIGRAIQYAFGNVTIEAEAGQPGGLDERAAVHIAENGEGVGIDPG